MVDTIIRTKRIFNRDIAMVLVNKGFTILKIETHKDNSKWLVYHFADTVELRDAFTTITNIIKNQK